MIKAEVEQRYRIAVRKEKQQYNNGKKSIQEYEKRLLDLKKARAEQIVDLDW